MTEVDQTIGEELDTTAKRETWASRRNAVYTLGSLVTEVLGLPAGINLASERGLGWIVPGAFVSVLGAAGVGFFDQRQGQHQHQADIAKDRLGSLEAQTAEALSTAGLEQRS